MGNNISDIEKEAAQRKCMLCKNTLSVAPIMILSDDGTETKCGRCESVPKTSIGRIFEYENLVNKMSFPCIYEGCKQVIPWKEVSKHEDGCSERTIRCPILTTSSCKDIIRVKDLEEHMKTNHPSSLYKEHFTIELSSLCNPCSYVVIYNNQPFLMMFLKLKTSLLFHSVSLNDGCFNYYLKLSKVFFTRKNDYSILLEDLPIIKYNERNHCFHCVNKKCDIIYHPHSQIYNNTPMKITWNKLDLTHMERILGAISTIKVTIGVGKFDDGNNHIVHTPEFDSIHNDNQDTIRENLQCPICMKYMIGFIHNCRKGHTICQDCRCNLQKCPFCKVQFSDSRNFTLEALAEKLVFSCTFYKNGCVANGTLKWLSEHETICDYNI